MQHPDGTVTQTRYLPFGGYRDGSGGNPMTDRGYTGHKHNPYIKLIDMQARWYDASLGRFISPDTIVPDPANPQSFNRYSYVNNRPINFNDPSGHCGADVTDNGEVDQGLYDQCVGLRDFLEGHYGVNIDGIWKFTELGSFGHGLFDIKTGLGGIEYFREVFTGTRVFRDRSKNKDGPSRASTGIGEPVMMYNDAFISFDIGRWTTIHEFGHVFDFGRSGFQVHPQSPYRVYSGLLSPRGAGKSSSFIFDDQGFGSVSKYAVDGGQSEDYAESWTAHLFQGSWAEVGRTHHMGGDPHSYNVVTWEPRSYGSSERHNIIASDIAAFQLRVDQVSPMPLFP